MQLTFYGAAAEVTGSCYLVEAETGAPRKLRFLFDCGMFQGGRESYRKNLAALGFGISQLDFVLLSHAHLDHSGLLPRLIALGYHGPVYVTTATVDLLQVMLLDSAHIQEKEAEWENRHFHGRHVRRGRLPALNIYVDSPVAIAATELTIKHRDLLDAETGALIDWQHRHPDRPRIRFSQDVQESMALNEIRGGAVIISASGMCDAGRIKYHLQHNLPRRECSVIITGFQAAGTLGRRLVDGARRARLFGRDVPVRADIFTIGGLSAHADQASLLAWLGNFVKPPQRCFVVHGEAATTAAFASAIGDRLHWRDVLVPHYGETFTLN